MIYSKSFLAIGCFVHDIPVLRMRDKYRSQLPVNVAYMIVHVYIYIYYARLVRAIGRQRAACVHVEMSSCVDSLRIFGLLLWKNFVLQVSQCARLFTSMHKSK